MKKIKMSAIVLLVLFGIFTLFLNFIPIGAGVLMGVIATGSVIFLNIGAIKVKGLVRKLVLWADTAVVLFLAICVIPESPSIYLTTHYLGGLIILIFMGLVVSILVNAYKIEKNP
jgi:hypothetical protein